jgi:hypothetical protein
MVLDQERHVIEGLGAIQQKDLLPADLQSIGGGAQAMLDPGD